MGELGTFLGSMYPSTGLPQDDDEDLQREALGKPRNHQDDDDEDLVDLMTLLWLLADF